jgi:hypothetical protein
MILVIYILGCIFVVLDKAYKTYEKFNFMFDYFSCVKTVLSMKMNYNHIPQSWAYFIKV